VIVTTLEPPTEKCQTASADTPRSWSVPLCDINTGRRPTNCFLDNDGRSLPSQ